MTQSLDLLCKEHGEVRDGETAIEHWSLTMPEKKPELIASLTCLNLQPTRIKLWLIFSWKKKLAHRHLRDYFSYMFSYSQLRLKKIVALLREEKKLLKKRVFKLTLENKQRERFSVVCTSINSLNMNTIEWRTRQRVARGWITRQRDWVANITTS